MRVNAQEILHARHRGGSRALALALLLLAAALTVAWTGSPQSGEGTVTGEVSNGTPGGSVPLDLTLTLHTFSDSAETGVYTTSVSDGPDYVFRGVALTVGETAVVRTVYKDVMYVSEFATIEDESGDLALPVTIYETTENPEHLSIAQLHFFVNKLDGKVQVGEFAVVANTGDRTFVGLSDVEGRRTWSVTLPEGADGLRFDGAELGGRFVRTEDGFADTRPVPPGEASVETSFTYEIPFEEGLSIEQVVDLPVRAAVLVLPEGGWSLAGERLSSEGTLETQMGAALSYTAGPIAAGEALSFRLVPREAGNGPAEPTAQGGSGGGLIWGIAALAAAGVAAAAMWTSGQDSPMPVEVEDHVRAIASLDRAYESGDVAEQVYRERRRSLKQKIRQTVSD